MHCFEKRLRIEAVHIREAPVAVCLVVCFITSGVYLNQSNVASGGLCFGKQQGR